MSVVPYIWSARPIRSYWNMVKAASVPGVDGESLTKLFDVARRLSGRLRGEHVKAGIIKKSCWYRRC